MGGAFVKTWTLSPQNETKLNQTLLFYILLIGGVRTHPTHPLPTGLQSDVHTIYSNYKYNIKNQRQILQYQFVTCNKRSPAIPQTDRATRYVS